MLAYHKETLYHSLNIGTALIVNWIISIEHQAGVKHYKDKHSKGGSAQLKENPVDCPPHVPWFVIEVDPPTPLTLTTPRKFHFLRRTPSSCHIQQKPGAMFS